MAADVTHLIVYGSGEGTNAGALIAAQKNPVNPAPIHIAAFVVSGACGMEALGHAHQVPHVIKEEFLLFNSSKATQEIATKALEDAGELVTDKTLREMCRTLYYKQLAEKIDRLVNPSPRDIFVFAGWNYIVTNNFFEYWEKRDVKWLINVHPADLSKEEDGKRKYVGEGWKCVRQAVFDGADLRTSIHIMIVGLDAGPIIVLGPVVPSPWRKGFQISMEDAKKFMATELKPKSDHPALIEAVRALHDKRWKMGDKPIEMK